MAHARHPRNSLFDGRWFQDEIIIWRLRWYFRYQLSYRDLGEMMGERGLPIAHTTIVRWAVRYADEFEKRWRRYERPVGGSWPADETYIKVRGRWVYL
jgi:transposase-like protein